MKQDYDDPVAIIKGKYVCGKKADVYCHSEPLSRRTSSINYYNQDKDHQNKLPPSKQEWNEIKELLDKNL